MLDTELKGCVPERIAGLSNCERLLYKLVQEPGRDIRAWMYSVLT
jgi:hypothetical protein